MALAEHDSTVAEIVSDAGGEVFKHTGDGFMSAFTTVIDALNASVAMQLMLLVPAGNGSPGLAVVSALHEMTGLGSTPSTSVIVISSAPATTTWSTWCARSSASSRTSAARP